MVAVGSGAAARVAEQIASIGSNLLMVLPGSATSGGMRMGYWSTVIQGTTPEYLEIRDWSLAEGRFFGQEDVDGATKLVSVTERTREIGLRMAVGARGRDILGQFLVEAVGLALAGGLLGILLGVAASAVIASLAGWPTQITPASVFGASVSAAAVGVFFGYYPARRAARLDPIDALRHE
jgi:hypothetical protein